MDLTEKICLIVETSLGKLPIFLLSRAYWFLSLAPIFAPIPLDWRPPLPWFWLAVALAEAPGEATVLPVSEFETVDDNIAVASLVGLSAVYLFIL